MKNAKMTICLVVAVLVMVSGQGFATIHFNDGGTHNIDYTVNDNIYVDYQAPGMQTTVNLLSGGVQNGYNMYGYNNSRINVSGGQINSSGESFDYPYTSLSIYDSSQLTMSSGGVGKMYALNNSQITMSGGWVSILRAYGSSQIAISGGVMTELLASNNSQITISGGRFVSSQCDLIAVGNSQIIIEGSNFTYNDSPVGFEPFTSSNFNSNSHDQWNILRGTYANGDAFAANILVWDSASIVLVPEPATLLLFGLGAVVLRRKR
jgi:hypothetical protein